MTQKILRNITGYIKNSIIQYQIIYEDELIMNVLNSSSELLKIRMRDEMITIDFIIEYQPIHEDFYCYIEIKTEYPLSLSYINFISSKLQTIKDTIEYKLF